MTYIYSTIYIDQIICVHRPHLFLFGYIFRSIICVPDHLDLFNYIFRSIIGVTDHTYFYLPIYLDQLYVS